MLRVSLMCETPPHTFSIALLCLRSQLLACRQHTVVADTRAHDVHVRPGMQVHCATAFGSVVVEQIAWAGGPWLKQSASCWIWVRRGTSGYGTGYA